MGINVSIGVPTAVHSTGKHRESGNKQKNQGKHREFGNFAKTQGIWYAQFVNSLILKVKYISIFAANISNFCWKLDNSA